MYSNSPMMSETILDGDEEADRKTVEWLRKQLELREQKRSVTASA